MKRLTDLTAPLRELICIASEFAWNESHTKAVRAIHDNLSNAPVMRYHDVGKDVTIQADASQTGLGAALMQPICYASRTMMETEQNYAQIDKELLAVQRLYLWTRYSTRGIRPQTARKYVQASNTLGTEAPAAHETALAEISTGRNV